MFISDQLIFLQLQKTGSTHIAKLLDHLLKGRPHAGHHDRLPGGWDSCGRPIIGSVRNPWDWYISLWAYGCDGKGSLYKRMTGRSFRGYWLRSYPLSGLYSVVVSLPIKRSVWRHCYSDVENSGLFRKWLHQMFDPANRQLLGERYGFSSICRFAGLYTHRYIHLFSKHVGEIYRNGVNSIDELKWFDRRSNILNAAIRMESLEIDLISIFEEIGISLDERQIQYIHSAGRTNTSSRKGIVASYYNRETAALVGEKERFIVEKYGYTFPSGLE